MAALQLAEVLLKVDHKQRGAQGLLRDHISGMIEELLDILPYLAKFPWEVGRLLGQLATRLVRRCQTYAKQQATAPQFPNLKDFTERLERAFSWLRTARLMQVWCCTPGFAFRAMWPYAAHRFILVAFENRWPFSALENAD